MYIILYTVSTTIWINKNKQGTTNSNMLTCTANWLRCLYYLPQQFKIQLKIFNAIYFTITCYILLPVTLTKKTKQSCCIMFVFHLCSVRNVISTKAFAWQGFLLRVILQHILWNNVGKWFYLYIRTAKLMLRVLKNMLPYPREFTAEILATRVVSTCV